MKYTLYVAGMPFDGNTIKEGKSLGGSETAGYYVARELANRGHDVFVFSNIPDGKPKKVDNVSYLPIGEINEKYPFGSNFMEYASRVPQDVLLVQRDPRMFIKRYNSKVNLWWCHDLALKRMERYAHSQSWNIDKVLTVSEFQKNQYIDVYDFKKEFIGLLPNAVDSSLYQNIDKDLKWQSKTMVYSSRPERGLEELVRPDGIMEKLLKEDQNIKLVVCGYDNTTPDMEQYYKYLFDRCDKLPNVTNYGPLSKEQLAELQKSCWLHVYPTRFEETSCITVMEQQVSGTPVMTTKVAALPETLRDGGAVWIDLEKDSEFNTQGFVDGIVSLSKNRQKWDDLHNESLKKSCEFNWVRSVNMLEEQVNEIFKKNVQIKDRLVNHYIKNSDIVAAKKITEKEPSLKKYDDFINNMFSFAFNNEFKSKYEEIADYNTNKIKNTHQLGNDAYHLSMPRVQPIYDFLKTVPAGKTILDYGCCVGHQTIAYARAFPHLNFTGCDIAVEQIKIGGKFAEENQIKNIKFVQATSPAHLKSKLDETFDIVLCSEVLEHTLDPNNFLDELQSNAKNDGYVMVSTPYGPHEEVRWGKQLVREHLHHFEEQDIIEMLGHKKDFNIIYVASHENENRDQLGNYCYFWKNDNSPSKLINYERKNNQQSPKQTVSVCMIVKSDGDVLSRCLKTVVDLADEIIIGIDGKKGEGRAWEIADEFGAITYEASSPLDIGFDKARNNCIERASKDWVLWIDDDEILIWPEKVSKYLRNNMFDSYAINQEHYSVEPPGLLKTDIPCRLFRNNLGMKFFGYVHEHPELELNKGAGKTFLIPGPEGKIAHHGYTTEQTRRSRFIRNWPLMLKDHEFNPERELGRFLFMRDLIHLNRFDIEKGNASNPEILERCKMALDIWESLLDQNKTRLAVDGLEYMTEAVNILSNGKGVDFKIAIASSCLGIGDDLKSESMKAVGGKFLNSNHIKKFINLFAGEKIEKFDNNYL